MLQVSHRYPNGIDMAIGCHSIGVLTDDKELIKMVAEQKLMAEKMKLLEKEKKILTPTEFYLKYGVLKSESESLFGDKNKNSSSKRKVEKNKKNNQVPTIDVQSLIGLKEGQSVGDIIVEKGQRTLTTKY
jgi:hypothetical protein